MKVQFTDQEPTRITILIHGVLGLLGVLGVALALVLSDLEDGEDEDCDDHDNDNQHAQISTGGLTIVFLNKKM